MANNNSNTNCSSSKNIAVKTPFILNELNKQCSKTTTKTNEDDDDALLNECVQQVQNNNNTNNVSTTLLSILPQQTQPLPLQ